MKKIIFGFAVAAAAIFGGYTASQQSEAAMSELQMENVEALGGWFSEWWNRPDYYCDLSLCFRRYAGSSGMYDGWEKLGMLTHLKKDKGDGQFAHRQDCECERQGGTTNPGSGYLIF